MAEDRRVRRTKRQLRSAFVAAVLELGYDAVTVEDIAERADISRATFYKYFGDKQALMSRIVEDLATELLEALEALTAEDVTGFTGKPLQELFRQAAENHDAYVMILRGEGNGHPRQLFTERLVESARETFVARADMAAVELRVDPEVLARSWVGSELEVLHWWLESGSSRLATDVVTHQLLQQSRKGRLWANGFEQSHPALDPA